MRLLILNHWPLVLGGIWITLFFCAMRMQKLVGYMRLTLWLIWGAMVMWLVIAAGASILHATAPTTVNRDDDWNAALICVLLAVVIIFVPIVIHYQIRHDNEPSS